MGILQNLRLFLPPGREIAALTLALGLFGCSNSTNQSHQPLDTSSTTPGASPVASNSTEAPRGNRPLVVVTTTPVCDLTRQIAGDTIELKCLISPGADPHDYKPKPEDSKAIELAKLILYGGYNFEPELIKLITATSNTAPKVAIDEVAVSQPQQFQEDGKAVTDPHVFHNATNGIKMAEVVNKNLAKLEPSQASLYAANTQKITLQLSQIDSWIKSEIATIPASQRKLVTTHDAFSYYSKAYGIPIEGALQGINTEEKPTPTRVKELVKSIKSTSVPTIFAEATINPKLIKTVAAEANVKVANRELFADGLGEKGSEGDTYQKMLIANTQTIVEGLGGKYTPFRAKVTSQP